MDIYDYTMSQIRDTNKRNLLEKLTSCGSNKYEFRDICQLLAMGYGIQPHDLIGLGTSCIVYRYGHHRVIKVCAKKIKFFHDMDKEHQNAKTLQKIVATMAPALLPIQSIIYDSPVFFAYIQDRCRPLAKNHCLNDVDLQDLLTLIRTMLSHGYVCGQIKPKNLGYHNHHLCLFDYHSLHPLAQRMHDKPQEWNHSLLDSLYKYVHNLEQQQHKNTHSHCNYAKIRAKLLTLIGHIKSISKPDDKVILHL